MVSLTVYVTLHAEILELILRDVVLKLTVAIFQDREQGCLLLGLPGIHRCLAIFRGTFLHQFHGKCDILLD